MVFGYDIEVSEEDALTENYDSYNVSEITNYEQHICKEYYEYGNFDLEEIINPAVSHQSLGGPMDSPWPIYCHDIHHTSRSPYSTVDNPGTEKWWFKVNGFIQGSGIIDNEGVIYFGSWNYNFYALYPDGSLKWLYDIDGGVEGSPAIDENGIIYVGVSDPWNGLYAFYPNGTLRWRYKPGGIYSSPVIGNDGTIYFGTHNSYNPPAGSINALYPNGTLRWKYLTNHIVYSSPAIDDDGIVYCGCYDTYLYAIYPDNGTLKWKYKTGHWIRTAPCIADDGTIYVVSLDNCLYAVNPDGTQKWITNMGEAGTSPTIGQDGTIYAGYRTLHAINPINGSVKWTFDVGGTMLGGTPCNSVDGTIYVGTSDGSELIAINSDGTLKWRKHIGVCEFAPIIDNNGTIYVGTSVDEQLDYGLYRGYISTGFFYKFDELNPDAPFVPEINGHSQCKLKEYYNFSFNVKSPLNNDVYYWIDWGDNDFDGWYGPYNSSHEISLTHRWWDTGTHTIRCRAKDVDDRWGPWGYYDVIITKSKTSNNLFFMKFLEHFPILQKILNYLIK